MGLTPPVVEGQANRLGRPLGCSKERGEASRLPSCYKSVGSHRLLCLWLFHISLFFTRDILSSLFLAHMRYNFLGDAFPNAPQWVYLFICIISLYGMASRPRAHMTQQHVLAPPMWMWVIKKTVSAKPEIQWELLKYILNKLMTKLCQTHFKST